MDIEIANPKHQGLAETIASLFELARWSVSYNPTPQEQWRPRYMQGIEIIGSNRHLVEFVAETLRENGVPAIRTLVRETTIVRDNPKWDWAQRRIQIVIGHYDDDESFSHQPDRLTSHRP